VSHHVHPKLNFSSELFTTSFTVKVVVVTVGHLVLSKLALNLVALGAQTAGEWSVNRMNIVDMHVQSLIACKRYTANMAVPVQLHCMLLARVSGSCATLTQPQSHKLSNKVYNPRCTPPPDQSALSSTCPLGLVGHLQHPSRGFILSLTAKLMLHKFISSCQSSTTRFTAK
jgi:hypothetical protein